MDREIKILPNLLELSKAAAKRILLLASASVATKDQFTMAVSGGSTPRPLYKLLATSPYRDQMPWPSIHLFWTDERCVAPDHDDSNFKLVKETLLKSIKIPAENIHRMRGELAPQQAADEYQKILTNFFNRQPPRFDLIFLGMGEDGHTASLFPGNEACCEKQRLVVAPFVNKLNSYRISLTFPVLNNAANVIFLVSGTKKANTLKEVLTSPSQFPNYPVTMVQPATGNLMWFIDLSAATELHKMNTQLSKIRFNVD